MEVNLKNLTHKEEINVTRTKALVVSNLIAAAKTLTLVVRPEDLPELHLGKSQEVHSVPIIRCSKSTKLREGDKTNMTEAMSK